MKNVKSYSVTVRMLRNAEHFDLFRFISTHTNPLIGSVPVAQPTWNVFYNWFQKEDIIFKRGAGSIETKYINEANSERHNAFSMFRGSINVAVNSFDAAEKDAAVKLTEILKNYKAIGTASMTEVDALIINMIQELANPRYADAVDKLGLTAIIDNLEETNDKFRKLYEDRAQKLEASEATGS
ncbi:MAG: DUF6261 family protein, partial [Tannerellaceae bacterium]|nr:DUF6261 family protein [Tannerellaceae bacterium]